MLAGIALAAVGTVPFALAGLHTSYWLLGAALVVRGAGLGTATIAVMAGAFQGLGREQVPHASSATRIMQYVGGSFGAAVLVAVILDRQAAAHAGRGRRGPGHRVRRHVLVVHRLHGPGRDPGPAAGRPAAGRRPEPPPLWPAPCGRPQGDLLRLDKVRAWSFVFGHKSERA